MPYVVQRMGDRTASYSNNRNVHTVNGLAAKVRDAITNVHEELNIYVSPNGKDTNDGSEQNPVYTITKAFEIIKMVGYDDTCVVVVENGNYQYGENDIHMFSTKGSGKQRCPISVVSEPKVVMSSVVGKVRARKSEYHGMMEMATSKNIVGNNGNIIHFVSGAVSDERYVIGHINYTYTVPDIYMIPGSPAISSNDIPPISQLNVVMTSTGEDKLPSQGNSFNIEASGAIIKINNSNEFRIIAADVKVSGLVFLFHSETIYVKAKNPVTFDSCQFINDLNDSSKMIVTGNPSIKRCTFACTNGVILAVDASAVIMDSFFFRSKLTGTGFVVSNVIMDGDDIVDTCILSEAGDTNFVENILVSNTTDSCVVAGSGCLLKIAGKIHCHTCSGGIVIENLAKVIGKKDVMINLTGIAKDNMIIRKGGELIVNVVKFLVNGMREVVSKKITSSSKGRKVITSTEDELSGAGIIIESGSRAILTGGIVIVSNVVKDGVSVCSSSELIADNLVCSPSVPNLQITGFKVSRSKASINTLHCDSNQNYGIITEENSVVSIGKLSGNSDSVPDQQPIAIKIETGSVVSVKDGTLGSTVGTGQVGSHLPIETPFVVWNKGDTKINSDYFKKTSQFCRIIIPSAGEAEEEN